MSGMSKPDDFPTVILIEDNETILQAVVDALRPRPFHISGISNWHNCLPQIEQINPDLIILDFNLPDNASYDLYLGIRASNALTNVAIIAWVRGFPAWWDEYMQNRTRLEDFIILPAEDVEIVVRMNELLARRLGE
jgi:DNA-binding response OmpR family regulator